MRISHRSEAALQPLILRAILVPLFVLGCYQFQWSFLRRSTTAAIFTLSQYIGLPMSRVGPDLIELNGTFIQFVVGCTLIDAVCGAIPLLWNLSVPVKSNLFRLLTVFVVIFPLNVGRLEIGFVAFAHGVPWWLAHESVSGLIYFLFLVFVIRQHAWRTGPQLRRMSGLQATDSSPGLQPDSQCDSATRGLDPRYSQGFQDPDDGRRFR